MSVTGYAQPPKVGDAGRLQHNLDLALSVVDDREGGDRAGQDTQIDHQTLRLGPVNAYQ